MRALRRLSEEEKNNVVLYMGCWLVFMLTGITKSNYTASIAYIVSQGIFTKTDAGIIAAAFYLFYGVGQVIGGRLTDKYSPYKLIMIGILGALFSNIVLLFTNNFWVAIILVWLVIAILSVLSCIPAIMLWKK